jgi:hypothetical protein
MSLSVQHASSFFGPLRGKTSSFVVDGRQANVLFAEATTSSVALTGDGCAILDLDALYSSNSDRIFGGLPAAAARSMVIHVPAPDASVEAELPRLLAADSRVLIIDSLNSLHHLLSSDDARSRSRKLAFAIASLRFPIPRWRWDSGGIPFESCGSIRTASGALARTHRHRATAPTVNTPLQREHFMPKSFHAEGVHPARPSSASRASKDAVSAFGPGVIED